MAQPVRIAPVFSEPFSEAAARAASVPAQAGAYVGMPLIAAPQPTGEGAKIAQSFFSQSRMFLLLGLLAAVLLIGYMFWTMSQTQSEVRELRERKTPDERYIHDLVRQTTGAALHQHRLETMQALEHIKEHVAPPAPAPVRFEAPPAPAPAAAPASEPPADAPAEAAPPAAAPAPPAAPVELRSFGAVKAPAPRPLDKDVESDEESSESEHEEEEE